MDFRTDPRFSEIEPFASKLWLASPTMHGEDQMWVTDAFEKNWITTSGENINEVEMQMAEYIGVNHAVALSCGTAALALSNQISRRETVWNSEGWSWKSGRTQSFCI